MKIEVTWTHKDNREHTWTEELTVDAATLEDAEKEARRLGHQYNAQIPTRGGNAREVVSVVALDMDELPPVPHRFQKTNLVTIIKGGQSYDTAECSRCGVKAKRFGIGGDYVLDAKYRRAKVWQDCRTATVHAGRPPLTEEDIQGKPSAAVEPAPEAPEPDGAPEEPRPEEEASTGLVESGVTDDALAAQATASRTAHDAVAKERRASAVRSIQDAIAKLPTILQPLDAVDLVMELNANEARFSDLAHFQRFALGIVLRRATEEARRGDRLVDRFAEATGIHANTLRVCRRLAVTMKDDVAAFDKWLRQIRHKTKSAARWYHIEELVRVFEDPTVLGPAALAERIVAQGERTAERMEQVAGTDEGESAELALQEAAEKLTTEGKEKLEAAMENPDTGIPRSEAHLRFVRHRRCMATLEMPPPEGWDADGHLSASVDAHHVDVEGTGIKGSDYLAVPLSHEAHMYLHQHGIEQFQEHYNCDLIVALCETLHARLTLIELGRVYEAQFPSALLA